MGTTLNYGYQKAMLAVKVTLNCDENRMIISNSSGGQDEIYQNLPNFPIYPAIQNKGSNPVQIQCVFSWYCANFQLDCSSLNFWLDMKKHCYINIYHATSNKPDQPVQLQSQVGLHFFHLFVTHIRRHWCNHECSVFYRCGFHELWLNIWHPSIQLILKCGDPQ